MIKEEKKVNRRDFLFTASYTIGAVGLGAVVWPLVHQMNPDKAQQALATTEVDISQVEPGNSITVLWRGKPIFLKRRTSDEIAEARAVSMTDLPFLLTTQRSRTESQQRLCQHVSSSQSQYAVHHQPGFITHFFSFRPIRLTRHGACVQPDIAGFARAMSYQAPPLDNTRS